MKREALLRELRKMARKTGTRFEIVKDHGKGAHYRVYFGDRFTTVQSGELTPGHVRRIKKQLGIG